MEGVAWATVIAYLTEKLLLVVHIRRKLHLSPSTYINGPAFVGYSLILAVAYLVSLLMPLL